MFLAALQDFRDGFVERQILGHEGSVAAPGPQRPKRCIRILPFAFVAYVHAGIGMHTHVSQDDTHFVYTLPSQVWALAVDWEVAHKAIGDAGTNICPL